MSISALRLYELYTALTIHFKGTGYNAVDYGFHTRVSEASLEKNRAKYLFRKIAPKFKDDDSTISYLSANMLAGKTWIGDFKTAEETSFLSYKESIEYKFEEDVKVFFKNGYTSIKEYVEGIVNTQNYSNLTFFILFDYATRGETMKKLKKDMTDNILFEEFENKVLTNSSIMLYCWELDSDSRMNLLNIVSKYKAKETNNGD